MNLDRERLRLGLAEVSAALGAETLVAPPPNLAATQQSTFLRSLRAVLAAAPRQAWPRLATSFNEDQVESKLWLVDQLAEAINLSEHDVVILGAWYGVLALILEQAAPRPPARVVCVDIDQSTCEVAEQILSVLVPRVDVLRADMMDLDYSELCAERPTVFINTSCEHLPDFAGWRARVPVGARLVLQSNNHLGCPEHVNCVPDLSAFEEQARLSRVEYRGTLPLDQFQRFMLIGRA